MQNKIFSVPDALLSLEPDSKWFVSGNTLEGLEWLSEDIERPTDEAIIAEIARLQAEYDALEYQRLRAVEYPDFRDYLDGVVKNDQAQIDAYIAACQAVKEKYPKPE